MGEEGREGSAERARLPSLPAPCTRRYGASIVLYNAWLPLLARAHWDTIGAEAEGVEAHGAKLVEVEDHISSMGLAWGYLGGVLLLLIALPFIVMGSAWFPNEYDAIRVALVLCGVWWLAFSCYTFAHLKKRPGPPLPDEAWSYLTFSWSQTWVTLKEIYRLPTTFKFIVLWFLMSDGAFLIGNVGALMARVTVMPEPYSVQHE